MELFNLTIDLNIDEPFFANGSRVVSRIGYNGAILGSVIQHADGTVTLRRKSSIPKPAQKSFGWLIEALGGCAHRLDTDLLGRSVESLRKDAVGFAAKLGRASRVCAICNRRLTDPDSMKRGIGPDCWEKVVQAQPDAYLSVDLAS